MKIITLGKIVVVFIATYFLYFLAYQGVMGVLFPLGEYAGELNSFQKIVAGLAEFFGHTLMFPGYVVQKFSGELNDSQLTSISSLVYSIVTSALATKFIFIRKVQKTR